MYLENCKLIGRGFLNKHSQNIFYNYILIRPYIGRTYIYIDLDTFIFSIHMQRTWIYKTFGKLPKIDKWHTFRISHTLAHPHSIYVCKIFLGRYGLYTHVDKNNPKWYRKGINPEMERNTKENVVNIKFVTSVISNPLLLFYF